ncbi:MAG: ABC transporter ATP-binding protein [Betaproteobacteria bacterium]|jgi:iron(III) transport system ATP-binding protein|nr:ABC transporter ATP-binding protein [Betaproteobacteria bacterium]NBP45661.1 ABC transporter ATP-binding protein [Betaproteobacteria bacterium]
MNHLEFVHVKKRYGPTSPWVVDDLNLTIERGELVTLLGPSGCGKTTVLRLIAGLELASEGRLLIGGHDVTHLGPVHRPVSMMFQSYALFPHLNVMDNVGYGLRVQGINKHDIAARALAALDLVGLKGYESRWTSELSGGQQQRVALARSLVIEPEVLLFDEPLSNLDARLRREMRQEIRNLQQRLGLTVVYVTHDQSEAMAVSDRICVMNKGQIAQQGAPRDLYDHPADAFVAGFMGEAMWVRAQGLPGGQGLQLGDWVWQDGRGHPPGELELAIRPEAWHLTDAPSGLPAQLRHCAFMGSQYELTLATALGHVLMMLPSHVQAPRIDAWVHLGLSAHGVVVLSRSS